VREALKTIERCFAESDLTIVSVATKAGVSARHLCREFTRSLGCTPCQHLHDVRVAHAEWLLIRTTLSIKQVADQCGCNTVKSLDRQFRTRTGLLPSVFRQGH
jgi:transcriptional regulator GlxA family with amidase domain